MKIGKRISYPSTLLSILLSLLASGSHAQTTAETMQQAEAHFQNQKWKAAASAFEQIVQADPANSRAAYLWGVSLLRLGLYDQAIPAFEKADAAGFARPRCRYNLACAYARLGRFDVSFNWLEKAIDAGFSQTAMLEQDDDLAGLRTDPRFAEIKAKAERKARPCENDSRWRQFDFWIGEWDVFAAAGHKAGENTIEKVANGCALLENWQGVNGATGRSLNYFDISEAKWKQVWVDSRGEVMYYSGNFIDGAMRFEGYAPQLDGTKKFYRMSITPQENGDVHQLIEESLDAGKSWHVWFDGLYKRKAR